MELMWYCHVTQWFHRGLPTKLEIQFMHLVKIDLLLKLLLLIINFNFLPVQDVRPSVRP